MTIQNVWRGVAGGEAGDGGIAYNSGGSKGKFPWGGGSSYSNGGNGGNGGSTLLKITDSIVTINGTDSDVTYGFGGDAGEGRRAGNAGTIGTSVTTLIGELNDVVTLGGGFRGKVIIDDGNLFSLTHVLTLSSGRSGSDASFVNSADETVYPMTFKLFACPEGDPETKLSGVKIESGEYVAYSRTSERHDDPEQASYGWATVWLPGTSDFIFSLDGYADKEVTGVEPNSKQAIMLCPLGTVTFYSNHNEASISVYAEAFETHSITTPHGQTFANPFEEEHIVLNAPAG